jgi:hypothetical protein
MAAIEITQDTKVSEVFEKHGDIAEVMEAPEMKRVGGPSFRRVITKTITVKSAAKIHRVPIDELLEELANRLCPDRSGRSRGFCLNVHSPERTNTHLATMSHLTTMRSCIRTPGRERLWRHLVRALSVAHTSRAALASASTACRYTPPT